MCALSDPYLGRSIAGELEGSEKRAAYPIRCPLFVGSGMWTASRTQFHAHVRAVCGFESPALEKLDRLVSAFLDQHVNPRAPPDPCAVASIGKHG
jgi:hypothetical protein